MSAKTKIVVLHMKELIYTAIFAALGILFIVLLIMMFLPDKDDSQASGENRTSGEGPASGENSASPENSGSRKKDSTDSGSRENSSSERGSGSGSRYIPGIYTTELVLGNQSIDVEVIVDKNSITSIRMVNLNDAITTMYPLLEPTFDSICKQVYELQTLEGVTYSSDSKYTSLVLLEAIQNSLDKAAADE